MVVLICFLAKVKGEVKKQKQKTTLARSWEGFECQGVLVGGGWGGVELIVKGRLEIGPCLDSLFVRMGLSFCRGSVSPAMEGTQGIGRFEGKPMKKPR